MVVTMTLHVTVHDRRPLGLLRASSTLHVLDHLPQSEIPFVGGRSCPHSARRCQSDWEMNIDYARNSQFGERYSKEMEPIRSCLVTCYMMSFLTNRSKRTAYQMQMGFHYGRSKRCKYYN